MKLKRQSIANLSVQVTARTEPLWRFNAKLKFIFIYWSKWNPWLPLTSALCGCVKAISKVTITIGIYEMTFPVFQGD
jgi:hypothetical protein